MPWDLLRHVASQLCGCQFLDSGYLQGAQATSPRNGHPPPLAWLWQDVPHRVFLLAAGWV